METVLFGFQFIDSDEDNDGYVDTDEEVSNGRVNLLNGSGPPYFHGYLYMKSEWLFLFISRCKRAKLTPALPRLQAAS